MQSILTTPEAVKKLNELGDKKSAAINQVIVDNLKDEISFLNRIADRPTLIKEFKSLQEKYGTDNYFLSKIDLKTRHKQNCTHLRNSYLPNEEYDEIKWVEYVSGPC